MSYFIISAPSGCGKTTIIRHLISLAPHVRPSVSMTTRPKREEETEGVDYYFRTEAEFLNHIEKGNLLEYARIFDHYYGTPKSELERLENHHIIFDVDIHGMRQIKLHLPDAISIFIAPPSIDELKRRLLVRNQDSQTVIDQRMLHATQDLSYQEEYDYIILNDQLNEAIREVKSIVA